MGFGGGGGSEEDLPSRGATRESDPLSHFAVSILDQPRTQQPTPAADDAVRAQARNIGRPTPSFFLKEGTMRRLIWKIFGAPKTLLIFHTTETAVSTKKLKSMTKYEITREITRFMVGEGDRAVLHLVDQLERLRDMLP
jgi:hypothetical protein